MLALPSQPRAPSPLPQPLPAAALYHRKRLCRLTVVAALIAIPLVPPAAIALVLSRRCRRLPTPRCCASAVVPPTTSRRNCRPGHHGSAAVRLTPPLASRATSAAAAATLPSLRSLRRPCIATGCPHLLLRCDWLALPPSPPSPSAAPRCRPTAISLPPVAVTAFSPAHCFFFLAAQHLSLTPSPLLLVPPTAMAPPPRRRSPCAVPTMSADTVSCHARLPPPCVTSAPSHLAAPPRPALHSHRLRAGLIPRLAYGKCRD